MKKKKIIPTLSLSIVLAMGATAYEANHLYNIYPTKFYEETEDFYYDDLILEKIEDSLQQIFNYSSYVPQGLCISNDYFFISMYDFKKNSNSIINVYDRNGNFINSCELYNKAHVGGISIDFKNNLLWIPSFFGNVDAYRLNDIVCKKKANPIYKDLYLGEGLRCYDKPFESSISYLTYYDNSLYVGNFTLVGKGTIKQYKVDIDKDGVVRLTEISNFYVPNLVQGLSFYEKNDKKYMLLSRSCGTDMPSIVQIFIYDEKIDDYTKPIINSRSFHFSPMIEQITNNNESLYSLYESQSMPYKNETKKDKTLKKSSIDDLLNYIN